MGLQLGSVQTINPGLTLRIYGSQDVGDQAIYVAMASLDDIDAARALAGACQHYAATRGVGDLCNLAVGLAMIHLLGFRHAPRSSLAIDLDIDAAEIAQTNSEAGMVRWPELSGFIEPFLQISSHTEPSSPHAP